MKYENRNMEQQLLLQHTQLAVQFSGTCYQNVCDTAPPTGLFLELNLMDST